MRKEKPEKKIFEPENNPQDLDPKKKGHVSAAAKFNKAVDIDTLDEDTVKE